MSLRSSPAARPARWVKLTTRPLIALGASAVVSDLGSAMTALALPWFVLETTGSASRMGLVLAAQAAPVALLGIPSSWIVARLGARRTILLCDALRAPLVAAVPILYFAGMLDLPVLLALAFLVGAPLAAHHGSRTALIPELLGDAVAELTRATAILQILWRAAYFGGPVIGGILLGAVGAPTVLLIDAATFAASFALVATFVRAQTPPPNRADPPTSVCHGLGLIWRDALIRPAAIAQALSQAAFTTMVAAVPVLAFTAFDRSGMQAGMLLGAWGAA